MSENETIDFHGWRFTVESGRTRQAYADSESRGAQDCSCAYCRNLVAQRSREYPRELLGFLKSVGVDPFKEAEVYELGPAGDGYTLIGGWWHFIGAVEIEGEPVFLEPDPSSRSREWNVLFLGQKADLKLNTLPPAPLIQVEFTAKLPWVLNEPFPSE